VHKAARAEELERGLRHPDGRDLPMKLDEAHVRVHGVADDWATEVERLSR
jgi:hypothetical protein